MMIRHWVLIVFMVLMGGVTASAQEPATRADALAREREEKSEQLAPPEPGTVERALLMLENGRLYERILNPPEGFYPKIGNITPGSGFAVGPAYRKPLFGERAAFSALAVASVKRYWLLEARLTSPELADGRMFADVHGRLFEYPEEDFFGLGPDSRREDAVIYGFRSSEIGASAGVRPVPWFTIGGNVDHLTPSVGPGGSGNVSIRHLFFPSAVPSLDMQPDFLRYELSADINRREPLGNPRRGGQYRVAYSWFDDRDLARYTFRRVDVDLQQYLPLLRDRRVIALRAFVSSSDADAGQDIPFYYQRTLGGPDDLRGFRQFRFRDRNILLLQAEYRWEIFTAVDGAIFYDAGRVAPRFEDLGFDDLESDYGIGFRFGTRNGVFLRVEGAFGSSGGKHFILRFGHVF
jgi:Omp85 superfamily domain